MDSSQLCKCLPPTGAGDAGHTYVEELSLLGVTGWFDIPRVRPEERRGRWRNRSYVAVGAIEPTAQKWTLMAGTWRVVEVVRVDEDGGSRWSLTDKAVRTVVRSKEGARVTLRALPTEMSNDSKPGKAFVIIVYINFQRVGACRNVRNIQTNGALWRGETVRPRARGNRIRVEICLGTIVSGKTTVQYHRRWNSTLWDCKLYLVLVYAFRDSIGGSR